MYVEDEDISSRAVFSILKKECFRLSLQLPSCSTEYPQIATIAEEYKEEINKMDPLDAARLFKDNKIQLIKWIRNRYTDEVRKSQHHHPDDLSCMGLLEAKLLAEALYRHLGI